jgi:hypothetical protein
VSPQSSVAFHPAVLIVVLRWYASNKLIFRRHASKNPGGLGAEPPRSMGSNSKTFRFSNRLSCLSPRRSLLPRQSPGAKGGQAVSRYLEPSTVKARGRLGEPSGFSLSRTLLRQSTSAIGRPGLTSSTQTVRCLAKPMSDRSRLESARRVGSRKTNLCLGASGSNCSLVFHLEHSGQSRCLQYHPHS